MPPRADIHAFHGPWERADVEIVFAPEGYSQLSDAERIRQLQGVAAVCAGAEPYNERVLAACPSLKIIARLGVGDDNGHVAAATRHGVWVTTTTGSLERAVAEATWMMILALARKLESHTQAIRNGKSE
jgi:lactate dehydrogenase-like 2-hydroxyacid dehydrogenase